MGQDMKVSFSQSVQTLGLGGAIREKWNTTPTWKKVAFVAAVVIGLLIGGLILASPVGLGFLGVGLPLFAAAGGIGAAAGGLGIGVAIKQYQLSQLKKKAAPAIQAGQNLNRQQGRAFLASVAANSAAQNGQNRLRDFLDRTRGVGDYHSASDERSSGSESDE